MNPHESAVDAPPSLFGNLLDERLLHYRKTQTGERIATTLPELFVAMAQDHVRDFPSLRPHQRHPWHAFLVQLAAIALHRAGRTEPFATAHEWRASLLAITPDDPDGAAWCLVSPVSRPAFMQAAVMAGLDLKWETKCAADEIDVIKASKNHDLKAQRMKRAEPQDWLFAIVSLQTQSPSDSGSYKESSRIDGGWGRRPGIGIVPPGGYGLRWIRDLKILLTERGRISETYGFSQYGLAITWLQPWDGSAIRAIPVSELDPFYIEISRRIRIFFNGVSFCAKTTTTPNSRIQSIVGGLTGDIWTPIDQDSDGRKVYTARPYGFGYRTAVNFLVPSKFEFSPAMKLQQFDPLIGLKLTMESIAWGPKNTNAGYHKREISVGKKFAGILAALKKSQIDELAKIAKSRIEQLGQISWMLGHALMVLFTNDVVNESKRKDEGLKERVKRFSEPFEYQSDAGFFAELFEEVEAVDRETVRNQWLLQLADRAELVLQAAFTAGPRSGQQRYRAQSAAIGRLQREMRGGKLAALSLALKSQKTISTPSNDKEIYEHV
jgi:CRISPR system Cascade subunit CasA